LGKGIWDYNYLTALIFVCSYAPLRFVSADMFALLLSGWATTTVWHVVD